MTEIETLKKAKKIILENCPEELEIVKNLDRLAAEKLKSGQFSKMRKANEVLKLFKQFQTRKTNLKNSASKIF